MCIARMEVSEESFNLRAGGLKMIAWVKSCLGLKIVNSHEEYIRRLHWSNGCQTKFIMIIFCDMHMKTRKFKKVGFIKSIDYQWTEHMTICTNSLDLELTALNEL
ncbi:hypothetical protein TSAR_015990 [Trichomalopsis sarcophagae]|uniref:Uncharacterized protein n=1 Tax=Trichomalopsis sarcophagae TaxID=543379 RepID=A0A232EL24_9HYME|nr:hypothetical protein TSAR_015990 [Trichomalopsis sarcophagae]